MIQLPFRIVQGMEDVQANFEVIAPQAVSAATPPGKSASASVSNNNVMSAPSQYTTNHPTLVGGGTVTGQFIVSYDPNGWPFSSGLITPPAGAYLVRHTTLYTDGATAPNSFATQYTINGAGQNFVPTAESTTSSAGGSVLISAAQVFAFNGAQTFGPQFFMNVASAGAVVTDSLWIIQRVN